MADSTLSNLTSLTLPSQATDLLLVGRGTARPNKVAMSDALNSAALAATTGAYGVVQLAASGGTTAGTVVQATDARLSDTRNPPDGSKGDIVVSGSGSTWTIKTNPTLSGTVSADIVRVGDGTAAAPSLSFTNDSDTGFYKVPAATDIVYFAAGGQPSLRLVSGGYLYSGTINSYLQMAGTGAISLVADVTTNQPISLQPSGTGSVVVAASSRLASTETGAIRVADSSNANRKLFIGVDNTVAPSGVGYIQSTLTGTTTIPLQLQPLGGSLSVGNSGSVVTVNGTTISTNTTTGALVVSGGLGVGGVINAGAGTHIFGNAAATGQLRVQRITTNPSSVTLNAVVSFPNIDFGSEGGGYTFGSIQSNSTEILRVHNANLAQIANVSGGGLAIGGGLRVSAQTASTSTITGAAVISGGVGIAGDTYVGGIVNSDSNVIAARAVIGKGDVGSPGSIGLVSVLDVTGGASRLQSYNFTTSAVGALNIQPNGGALGIGSTSTVTTINGTTVSNSTSSGALVVSGGVGIAGNTYIGGNLVAGSIVDPPITGTILEDIFTITDAAAFEVDPGNGSIQLITLGASRTPKATNFAAGESITLMVNDGTAYTLTWTDATWGTGGVAWVGGSAPTLATSGYTVIQFWKVGSQIYGARVGDVA